LLSDDLPLDGSLVKDRSPPFLDSSYLIGLRLLIIELLDIFKECYDLKTLFLELLFEIGEYCFYNLDSLVSIIPLSFLSYFLIIYK